MNALCSPLRPPSHFIYSAAHTPSLSLSLSLCLALPPSLLFLLFLSPIQLSIDPSLHSHHSFTHPHICFLLLPSSLPALVKCLLRAKPALTVCQVSIKYWRIIITTTKTKTKTGTILQKSANLGQILNSLRLSFSVSQGPCTRPSSASATC